MRKIVYNYNIYKFSVILWNRYRTQSSYDGGQMNQIQDRIQLLIIIATINKMKKLDLLGDSWVGIKIDGSEVEATTHIAWAKFGFILKKDEGIRLTLIASTRDQRK